MSDNPLVTKHIVGDVFTMNGLHVPDLYSGSSLKPYQEAGVFPTEAKLAPLEKKNDKPFTWLSYTSEDKILLIKVVTNPDNTSSISETVTLNRLTGDVIDD